MTRSKLPVLTPERALYEWLITPGNENGGNFQGYKVTQGYRKIVVELGTSGDIDFPIIGDNTPASKAIGGQLLLPRSDAFWANQFAFFIAKVAAAGDPAAMRELTFANPYVFTDATELEALNILYNGNLLIQIADRLYFQELDLKRFKFVGTAQEGQETSAGATGLYAEGTFNPMTGFYEVVPNILFSGQDTPQVKVTLPQSAAMGGAAGSANYAIMYFRGFYIPSGAKLGRG